MLENSILSKDTISEWNKIWLWEREIRVLTFIRVLDILTVEKAMFFDVPFKTTFGLQNPNPKPKKK
jgi:hypothetical protein